MHFPIKKIIFSILFNSSLFIILIIGVQNSGTKNKVAFITRESVSLPLSFIIGVSFISGSIFGNFINIPFSFKKK